MEMNFKNDKSFRLLYMYEKLCNGEYIYKSKMAFFFGVSEKTILRDISDLRTYLMEIYHCDDITILYNRRDDYYFINKIHDDHLKEVYEKI